MQNRVRVDDVYLPPLDVIFEIDRGSVPGSHGVEAHPQARHVGVEA